LINLIKNELIKVFKKKAIYILSLVLFLFVILTNVIYKTAFDDSGNINLFDGFSNFNKEMAENRLESYDEETDPDGYYYASLKSELEIIELGEKYGTNSWQYYYTTNNKKSLIEEYERIIYKNLSDTEEGKLIIEEYNDYIKRLENDDWRYYLNIEKEFMENYLKEAEINYQNALTPPDKEIALSSITATKLDLDVINYRLKYDIPYGNDYLNEALSNYRNHGHAIERLDSFEGTYQDKININKSKETFEKSKYIIETGNNINKVNDLRGILGNSFIEFEMFIIIIIVIVSGTIVSEEFNKGTIKLLLVKPYKRSTILLSKFLTSIIIVIFSILLLLFMNLLVGGILFGFDSLTNPVVYYNFNTESLVMINPILNYFLIVLTKLPLLLIIMSLAFMLSTVFTNSVIAITLSLVFYTFSGVINQLITSLNVKYLNFFITLNWQFEEYLFGRLPSFEHINLSFSIIMSIIYFVVFVLLSFITFKRKNIKNI